MVMIIETDKPPISVVGDARSILLVHTPNEDGLCWGCYEFACAFARFPCSQAQWAQEVLAAAGERPAARAELRTVRAARHLPASPLAERR